MCKYLQNQACHSLTHKVTKDGNFYTYLRDISGTYWVNLWQILGKSHAYLIHISCISQAYLKQISSKFQENLKIYQENWHECAAFQSVIVSAADWQRRQLPLKTTLFSFLRCQSFKQPCQKLTLFSSRHKKLQGVPQNLTHFVLDLLHFKILFISYVKPFILKLTQNGEK